MIDKKNGGERVFRKLEVMREQVKDELDHIPRGDFSQNKLRAIYWFWRMHSLGKKAKSGESREEVLRKAIEDVKKDHPNFAPHYDKKFFRS